ncbi:MAG: ABC transporter ATP-binding protein, partial [Chloroflexota bacterium]|nr:ABC transporter ATP-binding protein [Chloroflexota bacterium]
MVEQRLRLERVTRALRGLSPDRAEALSLRVFGGLDRPTDGEVYLADQSLSALSERELTELRRHQIGFVFQSFALLPTLSAFDNVALPLRIVGTEVRERDARVYHC